jgi:hypothetical protein
MIRQFSKFALGSLVAAAIVFTLSLPSPASAQARAGRRLQSVQTKENAQIRQGVKNGKLTTAQGKNLENHETQIQSKVAADKANGKLTPQEATQLKDASKKEEKAINGAEDSNKGTMPPTQQ